MFNWLKAIPVFDRIASCFVGEDSHKRTMGFVYMIITSVVYLLTDYMDADLYKNLMGFGVLWTGAAFSAKISKLTKSVQDMKETK